MISPTISTRIALVLASFGLGLATLAPTPAKAQNQNMEVIHHPNYDKNVFMPFVPQERKDSLARWDHSPANIS